MTNENKTYTFKAEEIFEDIPGDDKNVVMNIPEEIMKAQGWDEGTKVKILVGDQGTVIIQAVDDEEIG